MPKEHRLTSSRDFKAVFAGGRTYVHRLIVLKVLPKSRNLPSRFGFSTSSKLGHAVVRNRAKRLLREAVRLEGERVAQVGRDVVLIARPPIREARLDDVRRAIEELFRKAGLLAAMEQAGKAAEPET